MKIIFYLLEGTVFFFLPLLITVHLLIIFITRPDFVSGYISIYTTSQREIDVSTR